MLIPALYLSQFFHLIFEIHAKTVQSLSSIQKNNLVVNQYFRSGGEKERKLPLDNQETILWAAGQNRNGLLLTVMF